MANIDRRHKATSQHPLRGNISELEACQPNILSVIANRTAAAKSNGPIQWQRIERFWQPGAMRQAQANAQIE